MSGLMRLNCQILKNSVKLKPGSNGRGKEKLTTLVSSSKKPKKMILVDRKIQNEPLKTIKKTISDDSSIYLEKLAIIEETSTSSSTNLLLSNNDNKNNNNEAVKVMDKIKKLKKSDREKLAKIKKDELERAGKEVGMNKTLSAFLELMVFNGQISKGLGTLNHYRTRGKLKAQSPQVDIHCFDILLQAYASKSTYTKVMELFKMVQEDNLKPSLQTYSAIFECLGRMTYNEITNENIKSIVDLFLSSGYIFDDLFNKCSHTNDQKDRVLHAIRRFLPTYTPKIIKPDMSYICPLLQHLNCFDKEKDKIVSQVSGLFTEEELEVLSKRQLETEMKGNVTIKSIEKKDLAENVDYYRSLLKETEEAWKKAIEESIQRNSCLILSQNIKNRIVRPVSLYPFIKVLNPSEIAQIILQEIRRLAEGSETYSPTVQQLYRELGEKVLNRYQVLFKKEKGILDKISTLYTKYIKWYLNPGEDSEKLFNGRRKWQSILYSDNHNSGPNVDVDEKVWSNGILLSLGRFMYEIIMKDIKIDANILKSRKIEQTVPAFYTIFRIQGYQLKEEIKPHPTLAKLFIAASRDELTFEATTVPMVAPPLPWASIRTGGYLLSTAKIIRLPHQAHQQKYRLENCKPEDLYPSLDSLNQLGSVPWKVNERVLDIVIKLFNENGNADLDIPPPPSICDAPPLIDAQMTKEEKLKAFKTKMALKRKKTEMYSLWCDALYKFSLANHFRKDVIWFPHNMDFRGRVYPCPPHLSHLNSDVSRAILLFAAGKPLGNNGLDWLKIHAINLTGTKKKESIAARLKYANEIIEDILDSADNPMEGRKWWMSSEEPWQTLSCCIEIANALRSSDHTSYISYFPVHQDGSCNGLQHYAALGRDKSGATSVNLAPSVVPQDVYSSVANLVEISRKRDAKNGVKIAELLDGFISRKVIKQTVMTTVYGVTRYGARLQIAKQLKDLEGFPKEHLWAASLYLVGATFDSLREMFFSAKLIQDWFTESAHLISSVCGQNVEWITPLGLPIVQPYFKTTKKMSDYGTVLKLAESPSLDMFERPNVMKQKNAFPPNFIHSLDSSHMMLTSLHCERKGITFVSVHDCFWTHPASVEIMNKVCREQFVALHSQPILEDLSKFLVDKFGYNANRDLENEKSLIAISKDKLNKTLTAVPEKGDFQLSSVLDSIYFFS